MRHLSRVAVVVAIIIAGAGLSACGTSGPSAAAAGKVSIVAAENEYGNVASQIGGAYVQVASVMSNPNTDPHSYEVSPDVARSVAGAQIVVQNGAGYDDFMSSVLSATADSSRKVINVQHLLGLPDNTSNPHLWYDPTIMPAFAHALVEDLSAIQPAHAAVFAANEQKFLKSLAPLNAAITAFKAKHGGTAAATTEPVADYLLTAMGIDNLTPWRFQADIMNGTDPSAQDVSLESGFLSKHQVKVFCYNQQVVSGLTSSIRTTAEKAGVAVVGVYETMPTPGYTYQSWMLAEVNAITAAVEHGTSTERL